MLYHRVKAAHAAALAAAFIALGCWTFCASAAQDAPDAKPSRAEATLVEASSPAGDAPPYVQKRPTRGGTGKYYLGREIAQVVGHRAATWLDRSTREAEERTSALVANIDLRPDAEIADIGAGSGYFTLLLAPKVPQGKVYAVDIQKEMLDLVKRKKAEKGIANIETVLGRVDDTKLAANSIDAALLVDSYHEFSFPREMLASLFRALRPGGRLFLIEFRGEDATLPVSRLHKMTEAQARKELAASGFVWLETRTVLPRQHFMIFRRP